MTQILDFLTLLYEKQYSYSSINLARSALSSFGIVINNMPVGQNATIIRFLKGVFNLRPPKPKYCKTWDVSKVLVFLRKLSPVKFISLKELTLKLVMLIALSSATRVQTLHLLSIVDLKKSFKSYTLFFEGLIKQNRPGWSENCIELFSYPPDRRLCVILVLNEYLKRTAKLRNKCKKLFISYVKPYGPVTKDTISRWLKDVMSRSGIDVNKFSSHSIRGASTSKAHANLVPIDNILKVAGWSNAETFAKFYKKPIDSEKSVYQKAVFKL